MAMGVTSRLMACQGRVPVLPKEVFLSVNLSLQQIIFTKKLSEKELGKIGVLFTMC